MATSTRIESVPQQASQVHEQKADHESGIFKTFTGVASSILDVLTMGILDKPGIDKPHPRNLALGEGEVELNTLSLKKTDFNDNTASHIGLTPFDGKIHALLKESLIDVVDWSVSDAADTILATYVIQPNQFALHRTEDLSNLAYWSHLYTYWNGSIILRFDVIVSDFYKGRFIAVYTPPSTDAPTTVAVATGAYIEQCGAEKGCNSIEFVIPYTHIVDHLPMDQNNGTVQLMVVQPLTTTSSASIKVLTYARAGPDFNFMVPAPVSTAVYMKSFVTVNGQIEVDYRRILDTGKLITEDDPEPPIDDEEEEEIDYVPRNQSFAIRTEGEIPRAPRPVIKTTKTIESIVHKPCAQSDSSSLVGASNTDAQAGSMRTSGMAQKTFDSSTVVGRSFLVRHGQTFSESDEQFKILAELNLPGELFSSRFPTYGSFIYHNNTRISFSIEIALQSTLYNQGLLITFYNPVCNNVERGDSTKRNYHHVLNTAANAGSGTFEVPFTSCFDRLFMDSGVDTQDQESIGYVFTEVWSSLQRGPASSGNVSFSLTVVPKDLHVGVTRPRPVAYAPAYQKTLVRINHRPVNQGDTDIAEDAVPIESEITISALDPSTVLNSPSTRFEGSHMDLNVLLKRPTILTDIEVDLRGGRHFVAALGCYPQARNLWACLPFAMWSGPLRYTLVLAAPNNRSVMMRVTRYPKYAPLLDSEKNYFEPDVSHFPGRNTGLGTAFQTPKADNLVQAYQVEQISPAPRLPTGPPPRNSLYGNGQLLVEIFSEDQFKVRLIIYQSTGEGFSLYHHVALPRLLTFIPPDAQKKEEKRTPYNIDHKPVNQGPKKNNSRENVSLYSTGPSGKFVVDRITDIVAIDKKKFIFVWHKQFDTYAAFPRADLKRVREWIQSSYAGASFEDVNFDGTLEAIEVLTPIQRTTEVPSGNFIPANAATDPEESDVPPPLEGDEDYLSVNGSESPPHELISDQDRVTITERVWNVIKSKFAQFQSSVTDVMKYISSGVGSVVDSVCRYFMRTMLVRACADIRDFVQEVATVAMSKLGVLFFCSYATWKTIQFFKSTELSFTSLALDLCVGAVAAGIDIDGTIDIVKKAWESISSSACGLINQSEAMFPLSWVSSLFFANVGASSTVAGQFTSQWVRCTASELHKKAVAVLGSCVNFLFGGKLKPEINHLLPQWERLYAEFYERHSNNCFSGENVRAGFSHTRESPFNGTPNSAFLTQCYTATTEIRSYVTNEPALSKFLKFCTDVEEEWKAFSHMSRSSTRPEPVGIFISGAPGIGKSLLTSSYLPTHLLTLCHFVKERKHADSLVYSLPMAPEQKFLDGYNNQPYVFIDDLGAIKDSPIVALLPNLISTASAPVNQASLERKGLVFTSDFVAASSNSPRITHKDFNTPANINRRFPVAYNMTLRPAFERNGLLDSEKFITALGNAKTWEDELKVYDSTWLFQVIEGVSSGTLGNTRAMYSEVLNAVLSAYNRRFHLHNSKIHVSSVKIPTSSIPSPIQKTVDPIATIAITKTFEPTAHKAAGQISGEHKPHNQIGKDVPKSSYQSPNDDQLWSYCDDGLEWGNATRPIPGSSDEELQLAISCLMRDIKTRTLSYSNYTACLIHGASDDSEIHVRARAIMAGTLGSWPQNLTDPNLTREEKWSVLYAYVTRPEFYIRDFSEFSYKAQCYAWAPSFASQLCSFGLFMRKLFLTNAAYLASLAAFLFLAHSVITILMAVLNFIFPPPKPIPQYGPPKTGVVKMKPLNQQLDPKVIENQLSRVVTNTIQVKISYRDEHRIGTVLLYNNRHLICPHHYLADFPDYKDITFEIPFRSRAGQTGLLVKSGVNWVYMIDALGLGEACDGVLVQLSLPCGSYRDIGSCLMNSQDMDAQASRPFNITLLGEGIGAPDLSSVVTFRTDKSGIKLGVAEADHTKKKVTYITFRSSFTTGEGFCGRPYVTPEGKVMGMHVAASTSDPNYLFMCPLYKEYFDQLLPEINKVVISREISGVPENQLARASFITLAPVAIGHECVAELCPKDFPIHTSAKTDYVHSRIRDEDTWPDGKQPTITTPPRMLIALEKHGQPKTENWSSFKNRGNIEPIEVAACVEIACEELKCVSTGTSLKWHEVLNSGIDYDTSAGCWGPSKKDYVEFVGDCWQFSTKASTYIHPVSGTTLLQELLDYESTSMNGERKFAWWNCSLKKELTLKTEKNRVFECPPLHIHLLCVKYFGQFKDSYVARWNELGHSLGCDTDALWAHVYSRLRSCTSIFDLDFKNFDSCIHPAAFDHLLQLTTRYYKHDPRDEAVRSTLLDEIQSNLAIAHTQYGIHLYSNDGGNPSGNYLTSIINCEANKQAVRVAFMRTCSGLTFEDLRNLVVLIVCGDDVVAGHRGIRDFQLEPIVAVLRDLGYKPTPADKTGEWKELSLETITFLKRHFRYDNEVIMGPIALPTIYALLNWSKKKHLYSDAQLIENCLTAMTFAAHHGVDFYTSLHEDIINRLFVAKVDLTLFDPPSFPYVHRSILHKQCTLLGRTPSLVEKFDPEALRFG